MRLIQFTWTAEKREIGRLSILRRSTKCTCPPNFKGQAKKPPKKNTSLHGRITVSVVKMFINSLLTQLMHYSPIWIILNHLSRDYGFHYLLSWILIFRLANLSMRICPLLYWWGCKESLAVSNKTFRTRRNIKSYWEKKPSAKLHVRGRCLVMRIC